MMVYQYRKQSGDGSVIEPQSPDFQMLVRHHMILKLKLVGELWH